MSDKMFEAHIIGPDGPPETHIWKTGHNIPETTYEARKGADGEIYVMYFYQGGEKQFRTIPKAMFDKAKADFGY
jgi:hypothetical protein